MAFKLASHFGKHSPHPHSTDAAGRMPHAASIANRAGHGARHLGAAGFGAPAGGFRFSDLPGFSGGLPQPAASDPGNNAAQQLKTQQDIYALMTGQGINVVVKNPNPQSTFS
ncbi:MAG TPA: hypothetical protein VGY55_12050 [Pirellulales bacterium]|jgi:hypothetical protein|nr:hypothetical protein [Pirellulales bacterium]